MSEQPVTLRGDKQCPHGHTARRKCSRCEYDDMDAEITRLRAVAEAAKDVKFNGEYEIHLLQLALRSAGYSDSPKDRQEKGDHE